MDQLFTVKETSKILKTSIHVVYGLIDRKIFIPLKLGSQKIPSSQIDMFIERYTGKDLSDLDNIKDL